MMSYWLLTDVDATSSHRIDISLKSIQCRVSWESSDIIKMFYCVFCSFAGGQSSDSGGGLGCCGYILWFLSMIIIICTLPFSLCLCIKVGCHGYIVRFLSVIATHCFKPHLDCYKWPLQRQLGMWPSSAHKITCIDCPTISLWFYHEEMHSCLI